VRCSVLQCVVGICVLPLLGCKLGDIFSVLQYTEGMHGDAVCCNVFQCVSVCCGVKWYVAVCCGMLQCVAVCCSIPKGRTGVQCVAMCCSVLQCVALCGVLQGCKLVDTYPGL